MDDIAHGLMWDHAIADVEAEQRELARTAALTDAEALWPLLQAAADSTDLEHRLALSSERLSAIAQRRGYPLQDLHEDLQSRFELLAEARARREQQHTGARQEQQAREDNDARWAQVIGVMASRAAADNPLLPLDQCIDLATQAAREHLMVTADGPLDYSSWNNVPDGPFTQRAKDWSPSDPTGSSQGQGGGDPDTPSGEAPASVPSSPDDDLPSDSVGADATDALALAASRKALR